MKKSTTDRLLDELNALRGLSYPQKGYTYFANVAGDGRTHRTVYTITTDGGGVSHSELNADHARARCDKIRAAIENQ